MNDTISFCLSDNRPSKVAEQTYPHWWVNGHTYKMFVLATLLPLLCKAENGTWKLKFRLTAAIVFKCDHLVFIKKQFEENAYTSRFYFLNF